MRHQNYKSLPPALRLQRQRAREKKASLARRALVYALKAAPCLDCGRTYPHYVMDFDHRPGELKTLSVSALMMRGSLDDVMAEVARCDLVCSNCHRERTWRRRRPLLSARRRYLNSLKTAPCLDCRVSYQPHVMDFDHRPGTKKESTVSRLMNAPLPLLLAEIAKCDLVCSNCHRERTQQRGQHV